MLHDVTLPQAKNVQGQVHLSWYKSTTRFSEQAGGPQSDSPWKFRIYRQTETGFVRGEDYDEYFMNLPLTNGQLVFEGELTPSNGRKFLFIDQPPAFATTYTYYIQTGDSHKVGPVPVRYVDPEVYWSFDRLNDELKQLVSLGNRAVPIKIQTCGRTAQGREIPAVHIGTQGRRLALVGLIHPGEAGPELIVHALQQLVAHSPELFANTQVLAIPSVNIDTREQQAYGVPWYLRRTVTGVDLNRNFPADWEEPALGYGLDTRDETSMTYRGPSPASATETQAVMAAMETSPPDVVLSYHALASLCSMPLLFPIKAADDQAYVERCNAVGKAFAQGGFSEVEYNPQWVRPGCTQGSLPLWVYQKFHAPSLDLEMGATDKTEVKLAQKDLVNAALLADYQKKHTGAIRSVLTMLS